jgi:hypothetical protein
VDSYSQIHQRFAAKVSSERFDSALLQHRAVEAKLDRLPIGQEIYWIGSFREERQCILQAADGMWETFQGERGQKRELKRWDSEDDACIYTLGRIACIEWEPPVAAEPYGV